MSGVFIFYQEHNNIFQSKYILVIPLYQGSLSDFTDLSFPAFVLRAFPPPAYYSRKISHTSSALLLTILALKDIEIQKNIEP